ncbi:MAG TPA: hypothetical protein VE710_18370 [Candidatus Bathyarchaeia archaeon]|nr:hypothetical protein [Candidatus Bathyarchaeia archaeon]
MNENKSLDDMSVEEVLEMVESGACTAAEALELEKQGKNRKTLVNALEKLVVDSGGESATDGLKESKAKVTLLKYVKYKGIWYNIGQEIEVEEKDLQSFAKAGIIEV